MPKIIFLNGPPRSGKDHAIGALRPILPAFGHMKLSLPLKQSAAAILGLPMQELEPIKDKLLPQFNMSYRDMQIQVWQQMMLTLGEDWLGKCLVNAIAAQDEDTIIVSDAGRQAEMIPVIRKYGASNCAIIQIVCPGTSFDGDIRGYVNNPGIHTVGAFNDYTKRYDEQIVNAVLDFIA